MKSAFLLCVTFTLLCACADRHGNVSATSGPNGVYYWKTVWSPSSADYAFLRRHHIGRIYLRMFDVVVDTESIRKDRLVPNATVRIANHAIDRWQDSLSHISIVPVVYITLEALKEAEGHEGRLAANMVTRVSHMCSYNELPRVTELQLDCDWTTRTERSFFALCDSVRIQIERQHLLWSLSSTIRLHQLSHQVPPVDRGVLMVYNTGDFRNPDTANSILDEAGIRPYLKYLGRYPLPLDVAYPTYSWQLLFRKRQFVGLLRDIDLSDTTRFCSGKQHTYTAIDDVPYRTTTIRKGDVIRNERCQHPDIIRIKGWIDWQLSGKPHSNILYHLDMQNLTQYTTYEIEELLSAPQSK